VILPALTNFWKLAMVAPRAGWVSLSPSTRYLSMRWLLATMLWNPLALSAPRPRSLENWSMNEDALSAVAPLAARDRFVAETTSSVSRVVLPRAFITSLVRMNSSALAANGLYDSR